LAGGVDARLESRFEYILEWGEKRMKKEFIVGAAMLSVCLMAGAGFAEGPKEGKVDGKKGFEKHCSSCHPKGGNIVNPKKTLEKAALKANGVKSAKDIIAKMRKPGPGMNTFDVKTVSDKEAKAIAEYILKTFK
jgi:cytochrome c6